MGIVIQNYQLEQFRKMCPIPKYPRTGSDRIKYFHKHNQNYSLDRPQYDEDEFPTNKVKQVEETREMIEEHIARRVDALFMQLIVTYKTPYHYRIGETEHQGQSTKGLLKDEKRIGFASAHSSTIPCLYAFRRDEWQKWIENGRKLKDKPKGFVYVRDANTYLINNSTVGVLATVNQADIAIDGGKVDDKLRKKTKVIINHVALGTYSPVEGLKLFVKEAIACIKKELENQPKKERTKILKIYKNVLKDQLEQLNDPEEIDKKLGLEFLESVEQANPLRKKVYKCRFHLIRDCELIRSMIWQKINKLALSLKKVDKDRPTFDLVFMRTLLKRAQSVNDKKRLVKMFCLGSKDLKKLLAQKKGVDELNKLMKDNRKEIDKLLKSLKKDFKNIGILKKIYRFMISKAVSKLFLGDDFFLGAPKQKKRTTKEVENDDKRRSWTFC